MTTATAVPHDSKVRDLVLQELAWESSVDASGIGVTAKDGAVTLTGFVDSYPEKLAAERAAKRVRGVRAVADEIQVRLRFERTDDAIAQEVAQALRLRLSVPETVQASVRLGQVTLTGLVSNLFQRACAEKAVRHVKGVKHIINRVEVAPTASPSDIERQIVHALRREATIEAHRIHVTIAGSKVRLTGVVASFQERESAEQAASHAPGVTIVDNQLSVAWPEARAFDNPSDTEIC